MKINASFLKVFCKNTINVITSNIEKVKSFSFPNPIDNCTFVGCIQKVFQLYEYSI